MPMPFFAMRGVRKYVAGEVGPHVNVAGSRQSFKTCGMRYARGVLRNWCGDAMVPETCEGRGVRRRGLSKW